MCIVDSNRQIRDMDKQLHEMKLALLSSVDNLETKSLATSAPSSLTYTSLVGTGGALSPKAVGDISLQPDVIVALFQEYAIISLFPQF